MIFYYIDPYLGFESKKIKIYSPLPVKFSISLPEKKLIKLKKKYKKKELASASHYPKLTPINVHLQSNPATINIHSQLHHLVSFLQNQQPTSILSLNSNPKNFQDFSMHVSMICWYF